MAQTEVGARGDAGTAAGQLVLAEILDGVTLANISTPASSFGAGAPAGALAKASAQTSLLYICGGLPLFLGGELATPVRTIRRGLTGAFLVTATIVVLAAPFTLIDPDGFYDTLVMPSLVALWLSQLIVFAVYPLLAIKRGRRVWPAWTLSLIASAFAVYGLVTTLQQASS